MDLDDLDAMVNRARAPPRTTKFAPKLAKASLKAKAEPSSKPKPEEPAPAPGDEPRQVHGPIRSKKEEGRAETAKEEEPDLKPSIGTAAPKTEPSTSNGTVEMEVESAPEEKAEPMDEDVADEDGVVREIDVYLNPSIDANTQLYVLQYPLRPCWRPYEMDDRCEEVRVRPDSLEVEVDLSVDVDSKNYSSECDSRLMMTKQTLSSFWGPPRVSSYAVGVLMGNKLYLNPVHAAVQLRPSMKHLNPGASKGIGKTQAEPSIKAEEPSENNSIGPSNKQDWIRLEYHSSKSDVSARYLQGMMAKENSPILFPMNPCDYVDSLCPGSSKQNVKIGAPSRRMLLSTPLDERIGKLLLEEPHVHRYSQLRHFAPDVSDDEFLKHLLDNALLVQGCWVLKNTLLLKTTGLESLARDYTLLLFHQKSCIHISELPKNKRFVDIMKKYLNTFAVERPSLGDWKFKEQTDVSFMKRYPNVVSEQERCWESAKVKILEYLAKSGIFNKNGKSEDKENGKAKPSLTNKAGKLSSLDKTSVKAPSGVVSSKGGMSNATREALPKALQKIFQQHKVCSFQLICQRLRELALSQASTPKADAKKEIAAACAVDAPPAELMEVINHVAVEIHGLYVLKSSSEHPDLDDLRRVVIDLLVGKGPKATLKRAEIFEAARMILKREISNADYTKVINDLCESKGSLWFLKNSNVYS